jgi:tRNA threonylcarbamoyladenosine biosynthesis protein TsaB
MIILAIESSGLVASVAIATEDSILAEYTINHKKTHSQTLLPMLDEIVRMTGLKLQDVDAIAVSAGPGSFTGLRIGSATAKGLALALEKPIVAVPTLDSLAYNLYGTNRIICPMTDARRNRVYTGLYNNDSFNVILSQTVMPVEEIISKINAIGRDAIFLGDGAPVYKEMIEKLTEVDYTFAPVHMNRQRAGSVGAMGIKLYKNSIIQTAAEHQPVYLSLSQAERERLKFKQT